MIEGGWVILSDNLNKRENERVKDRLWNIGFVLDFALFVFAYGWVGLFVGRLLKRILPLLFTQPELKELGYILLVLSAAYLLRQVLKPSGR